MDIVKDRNTTKCRSCGSTLYEANIKFDPEECNLLGSLYTECTCISDTLKFKNLLKNDFDPEKFFIIFNTLLDREIRAQIEYDLYRRSLQRKYDIKDDWWELVNDVVYTHIDPCTLKGNERYE